MACRRNEPTINKRKRKSACHQTGWIKKKNLLPAVKLLLPAGEIRVMCYVLWPTRSKFCSWDGRGHSVARDEEAEKSYSWICSVNINLSRVVVTLCTTSFNVKKSTFSPCSIFYGSQKQTPIKSPYNSNWLVFITERGCVYCAVRTGSLYTVRFNIQLFDVLPITLYLCVLCGYQNKQRLFPYTSLADWFL